MTPDQITQASQEIIERIATTPVCLEAGDWKAIISAILSRYAEQGKQPEFGPGEYSCCVCGFGMVEPCEHWKAMESRASSASPESIGLAGEPYQSWPDVARIWKDRVEIPYPCPMSVRLPAQKLVISAEPSDKDFPWDITCEDSAMYDVADIDIVGAPAKTGVDPGADNYWDHKVFIEVFGELSIEGRSAKITPVGPASDYPNPETHQSGCQCPVHAPELYQSRLTNQAEKPASLDTLALLEERAREFWKKTGEEQNEVWGGIDTQSGSYEFAAAFAQKEIAKLRYSLVEDKLLVDAQRHGMEKAGCGHTRQYERIYLFGPIGCMACELADAEKEVRMLEDKIGTAESDRDKAKQQLELSEAREKNLNALFLKIHEIIEKAFPDQRLSDFDVLDQGVHRILAERDQAKADFQNEKQYWERETILKCAKAICSHCAGNVPVGMTVDPSKLQHPGGSGFGLESTPKEWLHLVSDSSHSWTVNCVAANLWAMPEPKPEEHKP